MAVLANMTAAALGVLVNGEHKITSDHRSLPALIYRRQSSTAQVREHTECTMRQYGLAEEAVRAGLGPPRTWR